MTKKYPLVLLILSILLFIFCFGVYKLDKYYNRTNTSLSLQETQITTYLVAHLENTPKLSTNQKLTLGSGYFALGRYDDAIKIFKIAAKKDNRANWGLALVYDKLEKPELVIKHTDLILEDIPPLSEENKNVQMQLFHQLRAEAHWKTRNYWGWFIDNCKFLKYAILSNEFPAFLQ